MWRPPYQPLCYILNGLLILCICVCPLFCETHWTLNNNDKDVDDAVSRVISVTGSPLCLKQPHSLVDFLEQHNIVEKMRKLQNHLRTRQKTTFMKKKKPESEEIKKVRDTNKDCRASNKIKYEEKTFTDFFQYDLMPTFTHAEKYKLPPKVKDIMKLSVLQDLFFAVTLRKGGEPLCGNVFISDTESAVIKIADTFANTEYAAEDYLMSVSKDEVTKIGELLSAAIDDRDFQFFALYYAGFYWRYLGNPREAATCLQKHLIMSISTAGIYQIGCLHTRARDYYHAIAAFRTTKETLANGFNSQWFQAGGDVHVLAHLPKVAENYYQAAMSFSDDTAELGVIAGKISLLACENAIAEMEGTATPKEETVELKESMVEWEKRQSQMFERMLPIDQWFRGKYAYEHLVDGAMDGLDCHGKKNAKGKLVLQCEIENMSRYNQSLLVNRQKNREKRFSERFKVQSDIMLASMKYLDYLDYMYDAQIALHKYLQTLEPYISVDIDEAPYPKKFTVTEVDWRTTISSFTIRYPYDCHGMESFDLRRHYSPSYQEAESSAFPAFPELFIPPENKGFNTPYILTTLLALGPSDLNPLPWMEPYCASFFPEVINETVEVVPGLPLKEFDVLLGYNEKALKDYLVGVLGGDSKALIGDIGQRIARLLRYKIGPRWIAGNLAAIYWRHLGNAKEAALCLKLALLDQRHQDVAFVQLAQLTVRLGAEFVQPAKRIAQLALKIDPAEPVSHYVLGYMHFLSHSFYQARAEFAKAFQLDSEFEDAKTAVLGTSCLRKASGVATVRTNNLPLCCWPSEHHVYCFGVGSQSRCFRLLLPDTPDDKLDFEYVRCSGKYTRQSYRAPAVALILAPYYISMAELNDLLLQRRLNSFKVTEETEHMPVFALDYGGFDQSRFTVYEQALPNMDMYEPEMTDFGETRRRRLRKEQESDALTKARMSDKEFNEKVKELNRMSERKQVVKLDVTLPAYLPEPSQELVAKGLKYLKAPKLNTLADYCVMTEKNKRVLDHPSPTYIAVTAKGVRLEDYVDLTAPVTTISKNEPVCPDVDSADEWRALDDLPAFRFREHFKFYKPEIGLTDALMSLGHKHERVEHVAARLHFAMKTSKLNSKHSHLQDDGVNGVVTAVSTLYWRVKGDAVNALKCLRHALKNLSKDKKDTALISMANIYHQAGFLHSALIAGGKAHEMTPDLVVVHFTLANIYATMGDHERALKFFYSTLALQPSFQQAKERIRAIYCLTHGQIALTV